MRAFGIGYNGIYAKGNVYIPALPISAGQAFVLSGELLMLDPTYIRYSIT